MNDVLNSFVGELDKTYGPVVRGIKVVRSPTGDKFPVGEDNSMSQEAIKESRQSVADPNAHSISLKYMPDVFVVDFDFKENIAENELFQRLKDMNGFMTETVNGYHFWTIINGVPPYSNETKIGNTNYFGPEGPIDLLAGNKNVWEEHRYKCSGSGLSTNEWEDISKYFNEEKMNIEPVVVQGLTLELEEGVDVEDPDFAGLDQDCPRCPKEEFMEYLDRLNQSRCDSYEDWVKVSMIIHNNFDELDGYGIFKEWSQKSEKFNEAKNKTRWKSFAKKKPAKPLTYKTLVNMAEQDSPSNILRTLYDTKGERAMVEYMNQTICYLRASCKVEYIWIPEPDSIKFQIKSPAGIAEDYKHLCWFYKVGEVTKVRDPSRVFRESQWKKQIERIDFDPRPNAPKNIFNLWRGYHITKETAVASDKADALLNHIKLSWCDNNEIYCEYALNWMAWTLQFPDKKIGVMMALASLQGCGKGIVIDILSYIMDGDNEDGYFGQYSSMESILGSYSYALEGKTLINLDEAFWGGDKKLEGVMKNLITETRQEIKKKFCAPYFIRNTSAFITTTNNYLYVGITEDDRRHFCLRVKNMTEGMSRPDKKAYFRNISKKQRNGEVCHEVASAFAHHLYNRDLSAFNPDDFPKTKESQDQMIKGWNSAKRFWFHSINEASFGKWKDDTQEDNVMKIDSFLDMSSTRKGVVSNGDPWIYKPWIYERYLGMKMGDYVPKLASNEFFKQTRQMFDDHFVQKQIHPGVTRAIRVYPLEKMRDIFRATQPCGEGIFDCDDDEDAVDAPLAQQLNDFVDSDSD
jgi:hypothetical protein